MPAAQSFALPDNALEITLALALVATLAAAAALAVGRAARDLLMSQMPATSSVGVPLGRATVRLVRLVTFLIAFLVLLFPALDLAGVEPPTGLQAQGAVQWAAGNGLRIVIIVLLAFAVSRMMSAILARAEQDLAVGTGVDRLERQKRAQTVARLVRRGLAGLVWATSLLMVLRELDVDITPVLTGAGVLGLAIGFGAQTLVRDMISGFLLIIEDQVRVGDIAIVNGTGGLVEQINLRTIVLRDLEGIVHVFPNGEIKTLANRTKDYSFYVIDLGVEYSEDTDRVVALLQDTGAGLMGDPTFGPSMLAPVEVLGVDDFKESSVSIRARIKTVPLKQWEVGREFRRRLKKALDREGIRIPFRRLDVELTAPAPQAAPPAGRSEAEPR
ncbi:MAG: mechanosensitive ion channel family protein [Acidobacteriota bacterium]